MLFSFHMASGRFQELVSSTLQPNLAPEGAEEGVDQAPIPARAPTRVERSRPASADGCEHAGTKAENPLLHDSEPVELVGAIGEGCEAGDGPFQHMHAVSASAVDGVLYGLAVAGGL